MRQPNEEPEKKGNTYDVEVLCVGEILAEILRTKIDSGLNEIGQFAGPFAAGASAIFASAVAKFGRGAAFIGSVGEDEFGDYLRKTIESANVNITHFQRIPNYVTAISFTAFFSDGTRKNILHLGRSAAGQVEIPEFPDEYWSDVKYMHIMGSSLSFHRKIQQTVFKIARAVKSAGGRIGFDPNWHPQLLSPEAFRRVCGPILGMTDIILPSGIEAQIMLDTDSTEKACREFINMGIQHVILKQGHKGSVVYMEGDKVIIPAFHVQELDHTGAGACFDAAIISGLLHGWDILSIARFANAASAITISRPGGIESLPTFDEVIAFMEDFASDDESQYDYSMEDEEPTEEEIEDLEAEEADLISEVVEKEAVAEKHPKAKESAGEKKRKSAEKKPAPKAKPAPKKDSKPPQKKPAAKPAAKKPAPVKKPVKKPAPAPKAAPKKPEPKKQPAPKKKSAPEPPARKKPQSAPKKTSGKKK